MSGEDNKWQKPEGEPLFVAIRANDADFAAAYARAEETFPRFFAAIQTPDYSPASGVINGVKLRLKDRDLSDQLEESRYVYLWLYDVKAYANGFTAEVYELPKESINGLKVGERIFFEPYQVYDWMIIRDGHLWSGLTMRLVRAQQSEEQKRNYDAYSGISVYEEGLPHTNG